MWLNVVFKPIDVYGVLSSILVSLKHAVHTLAQQLAIIFSHHLFQEKFLSVNGIQSLKTVEVLHWKPLLTVTPQAIQLNVSLILATLIIGMELIVHNALKRYWPSFL